MRKKPVKKLSESELLERAVFRNGQTYTTFVAADAMWHIAPDHLLLVALHNGQVRHFAWQDIVEAIALKEQRDREKAKLLAEALAQGVDPGALKVGSSAAG